MAKKTTFFCKECGYETSGWMGRCPGCGMFNTFVEAPSSKEPAKAKTDSPALTANRYSWTDSAVTVRLKDAGKETYKRHSTGMASLDRLFGGGVTEGSVTLVAGEPGIGKSTILMQLADAYQADGEVLYISGEESPAQIGMRASRLKIKRDILICGETRFEAIAEQIKMHKPCLAIVDSIQTLYSEQVAGTPGGVAQIREVAAGLIRIAKTNNITVIMVGHIAKDGSIAGPKTIEHMVDTVLSFEGDTTGGYRIIRSAKNRFGRSNEISFFEMGETGLIPVDSSKALLVAGRPLNSPGSVLTSTLEGNDALTIEVQALCTETVYPNPQRMTSGPERGRVLMLLAVCEKILSLGLTSKDCFINVIGGLKVSDPATDLAVCIAAVSSARGVSCRADTLILGEVGLSGEIRPVSRILKRCLTAAKLGIKTVVLPGSSKDALEKELSGLSSGAFGDDPVPEFIYADNLKEAVDILFS
ncbi:DNA repair protein RadA [Butyrivibrio sp. AE2032]|uniref:DNA repair protein RadA n=1 Tax=Butyrivibrio sp. AE2032 TaxID=1458463 RepID=UPI00055400A7|nr:DNA repair protein RadA [Butyrivibrio sp. AE2032]